MAIGKTNTIGAQDASQPETCVITASGFISQTWFYGNNQSSTEESVSVPKNQVFGVTINADLITALDTSIGISILSYTSDRWSTQRTLLLYCTSDYATISNSY